MVVKKIVLGGAIALVVLAVEAERIELKTDCASCVVETRGARIMSFRPAGGNRNEPAAVAELSEYSRAPSARELEFVESVPGFRWIGSRTLDILH